MTASTTHCWRKPLALERLIVFLLGAWLVGSVWAGTIEPRTATLVHDEQGYSVTAEFAIQLGPRLEEAITHSVPLEFRFEFVLTRARRYWMDEHVAGKVVTYRLSYQALTRQYRLSVGSLHQNFPTLDEALQALGHVVRLHVVDKAAVKAGETYQAAVRLSLDPTQLPKPLQIDALGDRDWRLQTSPLRWNFVPADEK